MSEHESLRRALAWLMEQEPITAERIAEASNRFDLSPLDEDFLRDYFARHPREQPEDQIKNTHNDDFKGN